MRLNLPQQIDKKQWLQRLGVKGSADGLLAEQLDRAEKKLLENASPQGTCRHLEMEVMELPGSAIKKHLEECNGMIIMAVTLGAGVDRLIRTSQVRDMAEAVILDAGASVLAEQMADELELQIHKIHAAMDKDAAEGSGDRAAYFTGRYSPGYGDFPIEMQSRLIKAVDGPKNIGLSVNESHILIPRKSITAIVGVSDHPVKGYLAGCDECLIKESCGLRKEGKNCAGL